MAVPYRKRRPMTDPRGRAKYRKARRAILAGSPACVYGCGRPATEADHVIPVSAGGTDDAWNLRPACKPCNRSRGAKPIGEWQADRRRPTLRTVYGRRTLRIF